VGPGLTKKSRAAEKNFSAFYPIELASRRLFRNFGPENRTNFAKIEIFQIFAPPRKIFEILGRKIGQISQKSRFSKFSPLRKRTLRKTRFAKSALCENALCENALCENALWGNALWGNALYENALCENALCLPNNIEHATTQIEWSEKAVL